MRRLALAFVVLLAGTAGALAGDGTGPWSSTLYYGPSTTKYFGAVLQKFNMHPTGTMIGLAVDRRLIDFGWDISLAGEAQLTQYFFGHPDTTAALGVGLQLNDIFGMKRTSFSGYIGPSYATDPPYTSIGYRGQIWPASRVKFLNFVGIEFAVGFPGTRHWDGVFRIYHRSGLLGVYSESDDDGLAVGLGIRAHF